MKRVLHPSLLDDKSTLLIHTDLLTRAFYYFNANRHIVLISFLLFSLFYHGTSKSIRDVLGLDFISYMFSDLPSTFAILMIQNALACIIAFLIPRFRNSRDPFYFSLQLSLFLLTTYLSLTVCIGQGASLFFALEWVLLAMKLHSFQNPHSSMRHISWFYFLLMPTLVYPKQEYYDRTRKIDWKQLTSNIFAFVLTFIVVNVIHVNWIFPSLKSDKNIVEIAVEVSLWTDLNFFLCFYAIFHCLCNILAELTGYVNRASFYGNWWFAIKVRTYIRCWSKPVSDWFFAHFMYKTSSKDRFYWTCVSILLSCTLHEVIQFLITGTNICLPYMSFCLSQILFLIYFEDYFKLQLPKGSVIFFNFTGHILFYIFLSKYCFLLININCK